MSSGTVVHPEGKYQYQQYLQLLQVVPQALGNFKQLVLLNGWDDFATRVKSSYREDRVLGQSFTVLNLRHAFHIRVDQVKLEGIESLLGAASFFSREIQLCVLERETHTHTVSVFYRESTYHEAGAIAKSAASERPIAGSVPAPLHNATRRIGLWNHLFAIGAVGYAKGVCDGHGQVKLRQPTHRVDARLAVPVP